MFTKYFYLVRHGETIMNKEKRRQGPEGRLSPLGVEEVEELGTRVINMKIDKMFVSPYERTRETAEIVNKYLKLPERKIVITPFLAERKNPTCIIGKGYDDPLTKSFIDQMDKTIHDPNLRIYDEENFQDLKDRALNTQKYLLKYGKKRNLCISHGIFIKMFLSTLLYGNDLSVKQYVEMSLYNPADNAGVTLVRYNYLKAFKRRVYKIFDTIDNIINFDFSRETKEYEEYLEKKSRENHIDEDSPWEILAYNDYNRDGFKRLSI